MPDLVPFNSGQVKNFYLFVLGQIRFNTFCISYLITMMNSRVVGKQC